MPKSKRDRKVTLSKTQKKGRARKESIVDEVRGCVDAFQACYVFSSDNMRNAALKNVRQTLSGSRIFFGRTKLLAAALGKTPSDEYRDGLHEAAAMLKRSRRARAGRRARAKSPRKKPRARGGAELFLGARRLVHF